MGNFRTQNLECELRHISLISNPNDKIQNYYSRNNFNIIIVMFLQNDLIRRVLNPKGKIQSKTKIIQQFKPRCFKSQRENSKPEHNKKYYEYDEKF